jgi:hypothetical protein
VAVKDGDGDGLPELIVGSGAGAESGVRVILFPGSSRGLDQSFDPFGATLPGGVYVG